MKKPLPGDRCFHVFGEDQEVFPCNTRRDEHDPENHEFKAGYWEYVWSSPINSRKESASTYTYDQDDYDAYITKFKEKWGTYIE